MDKEEVVKAVNELLADHKKNMPSYASPEDLTKATDAIVAQVKELDGKNAETLKALSELREAAEKQGIVLTKMQTEQKNQEPITFATQLKAAVEVMGKIQKGSSDRISLKAAPNHLLANITSDNIGMALPGVGQYQRRVPLLRSLLNNSPVSPNSHGQIFYTYQSSIVSGASGKAEGSAPATTSILSWTSATKNLREIKDKVRISLKAMGDVDFMANELNQFVNVNIAQVVESQLYNGTDATTSIDGVVTLGTTYTAVGAGDNAKVSGTPTVFDLIGAMKKYAMKDTSFNPGFCLMSHEDYWALRWDKDELGQYRISPFVTGPISIHGVLCLPSSLVTANTMLVGDGSQATVYSKGLNLQLGLDGNDFTEGYVTLLGVEELANIVKPSEIKAFQYVADMGAELAALAKAV